MIGAPPSLHVSRRGLLQAAGAALVLPASSTRLLAQAAAPAAGAATKADGLPTALLEAKPAVAELEPGAPTDIWGFGGRTPGPELRIRKDEPFRAKLVNSATQPLSVHWHGMRIANDMDGVAGLTQEAVAPGASAEITFTPPDAGTFIYRPLTPGLTAEQTERGLAGVVVVEDASGAQPVDIDRVCAVDDWRLTDEHQLDSFTSVEERSGFGRLGNVLTVNGLRAPQKLTVPPGARVRIRLANLCNARLMRIRFDGLKAYVSAIDGQPTDTFEPLRSTLPFAPGTRYDVIFEAGEAGSGGAVTAMLGSGLPLVEVKVEGEPMSRRRPALPPLAPLGENGRLPPAIPLQKAQRADVAIEGGAKLGPDGKPSYTGDPARIWTINGVSGATSAEKVASKPLVSVKRGSTVVLALANRTSFPQVMHLHGHSFRLLHPLDDGWEPYWLDTVIVPEGQTSRIAFVADNKGRWLLGSTVLERLDTGLSTWIEVT
ncbi:copper oxidase [Alsobacter soli]|uniref:Copper oxidase n=1 Tax=Alsobacter soli TaxID=2109933 RepID=A0A2T1HUW3_9HYPH|nr:multicopper oxidase family protein [Alsobacter soli]PSC05431.1 copper oxidase [Alsobacter soli]